MSREETCKVVRNFGTYIRVKAPLSLAKLQDIPNRDSRCLQRLHTLRIRQTWSRAKQRAHDWPEGVTGMSIVFTRFQRGDTGHASKNKNMCIRRRDRREAADDHSAAAGTIVTLSPQPQASVWFGLRNTNFSCSGVIS